MRLLNLSETDLDVIMMKNEHKSKDNQMVQRILDMQQVLLKTGYLSPKQLRLVGNAFTNSFSDFHVNGSFGETDSEHVKDRGK